MTILAGTGHRPHKIRLNKRSAYRPDVYGHLVIFATDVLRHLKPDLVITGMAQGWDQALAEAAIELGIPFDAYVPFLGQENRWPSEGKEKYHGLLKSSREIEVVCPGEYGPWKLLKRNEAMVDAADVVLALWDGTLGGTGHAVAYAESKEKKIIQCWPSWCRYCNHVAKQ